MKSLYRAFRLRYLRLLRLHDSPHSIAMGFTVGIAAGALPCMGVQSLIALPLAWAMRVNRLASLIGVWWTNPATAVPIYFLQYLMGSFFYHDAPVSFLQFSEQVSRIETLSQLFSLGLEVLIPMTIGSILMAIVICPPSYWFIKKMFILRAKRLEKRRKEFQDSRKNCRPNEI